MKTLKEYVKNYLKYNYERIGRDSSDELKAYKQGFIDATKLASENAKFKVTHEECSGSYRIADYEIDKQSILKAIEE